MKRGRHGRHLLKSDIEIAQANTKSAQGAAHYLNVSYNTYKRYAKMYGIFKIRQRGDGMKPAKIERRVSIEKILSGEIPYYAYRHNKYRFKDRLIELGYLENKCYQCGFCEGRITDGKVPLALEFLDGNPINWKLENLRLLCFNCIFLIVGTGSNKPKETHVQSKTDEGTDSTIQEE